MQLSSLIFDFQILLHAQKDLYSLFKIIFKNNLLFYLFYLFIFLSSVFLFFFNTWSIWNQKWVWMQFFSPANVQPVILTFIETPNIFPIYLRMLPYHILFPYRCRTYCILTLCCFIDLSIYLITVPRCFNTIGDYSFVMYFSI